MINRYMRTAIGVGISGIMLFGSMTAMADNCDKRMRDAQRNLDKQVQRHGEHSRQAEDARRQMEHVRESCHR